LHDGDLPVIIGHVMGLPVEETVLQAIALGTTSGVALGTACCVMLDRLLDRIRRQ
jgi:hypothetical protein